MTVNRRSQCLFDGGGTRGGDDIPAADFRPAPQNTLLATEIRLIYLRHDAGVLRDDVIAWIGQQTGIDALRIYRGEMYAT